MFAIVDNRDGIRWYWTGKRFTKCREDVKGYTNKIRCIKASFRLMQKGFLVGDAYIYDSMTNEFTIADMLYGI